jgi:hypothetical protein
MYGIYAVALRKSTRIAFFSLVIKQLDGNNRMKDWDAELPSASNSRYPTSAIVRSAIGLMVAGDSGFQLSPLHTSRFLCMNSPGGAKLCLTWRMF